MLELKVNAIRLARTGRGRARGAWGLLIALFVPSLSIAADAYLACKRQYPGPAEEAKLLACYEEAEKGSDAPFSCKEMYKGDEKKELRLACYSGKLQSPPAPKLSSLWDAWKLGESDLSYTELEPYRPTYLIGRWSSGPNYSPTTPTHPDYTPMNLRKGEAKFQLSYKAELISPKTLPGENSLRLWFAYTQQSNWQILDPNDSRPFRNTNYEPEFILTYRSSTDSASAAKPRLINLGFVHQSNGQSDPGSRSWNRAYLQGGWQLSDNNSLLVRSWLRKSEDLQTDDNPDIKSYAGRADMVWRGSWRGQQYSVLWRNNLERRNKSFVEINVYDPSVSIRNSKLPLFMQITTGYGESLIDYNYRQTTIGFGVTFGSW